MESKLVIAIALWVAGFVAGIVMLARWRRVGAEQAPAEPIEPLGDEPSDRSGGTVQRIAGPIVAGAKADVSRLRNATRSISHRIPDMAGANNTAHAS